MAEKKQYSPKEVALEVLNKAKELLHNNALAKAEKLKKDLLPTASPSPAGSINSKIGSPFGKNEIKAQVAPEKNPKEIKEENNEPTGMADYDDKRLNPAEHRAKGHEKLKAFMAGIQLKKAGKAS